MDALKKKNTAQEHYQDQGYYLAKAVFNGAQMDALEQDFDRIVRVLSASGEDNNARWDSPAMNDIDLGTSKVLHTHSVHRYSAAWMQAFMMPCFLDVVEDLIGPDIILHHSKLFQKPAFEGSPFPIHQDWSYFPSRKDTMMAGIIFLTDTDDSMGGLRVYPGSHNLGRLPNSSGLLKSKTLETYPLKDATPVSAKRGDVLFFNYFTLHGSPPNHSSQTRKTVLIQLHAGDDALESNADIKHHYDAIALRGWNSSMTRQKASTG